MQQATTNMRSHSRIAKPEGSAPRAPTHRSGGRPWVSRRNPSTPCRETEDLQHHRTYLAEKNQAIQTQTHRKPTRRSQTNNSNPTWRMKATEKVRPPAGRPQPSKTKRFHNNAICYVKKQASTYSDENIPAYIQPQEQEQPHNNVAKTRKMKATARLATRGNSWIFHDASFTKSWYLQGFVKT